MSRDPGAPITIVAAAVVVRKTLIEGTRRKTQHKAMLIAQWEQVVTDNRVVQAIACV